MTEWQINIREGNLPLLEALSLRVPAAPVAFLRQLCKKQRVTVDKSLASAERLVHQGERVAIKTSQRWQDILDHSPLYPAQLLYEDSHLLVLDKPSGLAVHQAQGHNDNLQARTSEFLRLRGEVFKVAPVHRLDIETSGAILFGKGRQAVSQLGQMVMAGEMSKRYLALVHGQVHSSGKLESPVMAKGQIKSALTRYHPVASTGKFTLLELELVTGRQHQIRQQLAKTGWPILGDARYHSLPANRVIRSFLHCYHLALHNPISHQPVIISCPLPEDLQKQLRGLEFEPKSFADFIE